MFIMSSHEEEKLLKILMCTNSDIRVAAFKRLVIIYKSRPESDQIYCFIEELNNFEPEQKSIILDYVFEFILEIKIIDVRVNKILSNSRIMNNLLSFMDEPLLHHSLVLVLSVVFDTLFLGKIRQQAIDCNNLTKTRNIALTEQSLFDEHHMFKWANKLINVVLITDNRFVQERCFKLVFLFIEYGFWPSMVEIRRFRSIVELGCLDGSIGYNILPVSGRYTFQDYLEDLKHPNFENIERTMAKTFIAENVDQFLIYFVELKQLYKESLVSAQNTNTLRFLLEQILLLIQIKQVFAIHLGSNDFVEIFLELIEIDNEDTQYLLTNILNSIMIDN